MITIRILLENSSMRDDVAFAWDAADQVIFMDGRSIVEQGDPRQFLPSASGSNNTQAPGSHRTRGFLPGNTSSVASGRLRCPITRESTGYLSKPHRSAPLKNECFY